MIRAFSSPFFTFPFTFSWSSVTSRDAAACLSVTRRKERRRTGLFCMCIWRNSKNSSAHSLHYTKKEFIWVRTDLIIAIIVFENLWRSFDFISSAPAFYFYLPSYRHFLAVGKWLEFTLTLDWISFCKYSRQFYSGDGLTLCIGRRESLDGVHKKE